MYKRSKKDNYRKKIEEMIGGGQKRKISSDIDNDDTNIINDNDIDVVNVDINESTSDINNNDKNDEPNIDRIRVQRWTPNRNRVEGIRKYLED
jgi:hypothetical protein